VDNVLKTIIRVDTDKILKNIIRVDVDNVLKNIVRVSGGSAWAVEERQIGALGVASSREDEAPAEPLPPRSGGDVDAASLRIGLRLGTHRPRVSTHPFGSTRAVLGSARLTLRWARLALG
jgi:hypothetical protein